MVWTSHIQDCWTPVVKEPTNYSWSPLSIFCYPICRWCGKWCLSFAPSLFFPTLDRCWVSIHAAALLLWLHVHIVLALQQNFACMDWQVWNIRPPSPSASALLYLCLLHWDLLLCWLLWIFEFCPRKMVPLTLPSFLQKLGSLWPVIWDEGEVFHVPAPQLFQCMIWPFLVSPVFNG